MSLDAPVPPADPPAPTPTPTPTRSQVDTPLGPMVVVASEAAIHAVWLPPASPSDLPVGDHALHREAAAQLDAYFAGTLRRFSLPLSPAGTPFQREVWRVLEEIPYGETRTYLDIATALHRPSATRAVGAANGRNPIAILVPCHRVIGADGSLTGYGGGLPAKAWLLRHEGVRDVPEQLRLTGAPGRSR